MLAETGSTQGALRAALQIQQGCQELRQGLPRLNVAGKEVHFVVVSKAKAAHIAVPVQHVMIPLPPTLCR